MRHVLVLIASCIILSAFSAQARTNLTEQQVKNTCGKDLQSAEYKDKTKSFGCEKMCGDKVCTYNCCTGKSCGGKDQQGCHGSVLGKTIGGKVKMPMAAYLRLHARQR